MMPPFIRSARSRCVLLGVIFVALVMLVPAPSHAGTYDVVACDAAPAGAQHAWVGVQSNGMSSGTNCPTNRVDNRGIWAAAAVDVGTVPAFSAAREAFEAPGGASIAFLTAEYRFRRVDPYWGVGLYADDQLLHGCHPNQGGACDFTTAGVHATFGFANGVQRVYAQTACGSATGCSTKGVGPPFFERAGVRVYSATVRVQDGSAPAVWDVGDGALSNGAWQRGARHIGYAGSDNVGIRKTRFYVDGTVREDLERGCDYTRRVPCTDLTYRSSTLDTRELTDGNHTYKVEVVDTAGNAASFTGGFRVDNTAPDEPGEVSVAGGEGWRQADDFDVAWTNPPSASQVATAHYELCNTASGACATHSRSGPGISSLQDLSVPEPGDYTLRIWLGDEAGNANGANRSEAVHLRFDNVPPGQAQPTKRNGWINAAEARNFDQRVDLKPLAVRPVSGVHGYSITTDGTEPDASVELVGNVYRIDELPEGVTTLKARAVSGSGVASGEVGETTIRVDKSQPEVAVSGAPPGERWNREPVRLTLGGTDQPGLSGMSPALPDQPIDDGAFLAYRLDGGEELRARGGEHHVQVGGDGEHTLTAIAVDAAGNESVERGARFKIDATAPELVVFESQDPRDPRKLAVASSDRTSGIADGRIEIRRVAGGAPAEWQPLETRREGDHFVTHLDDERLAPGRYELRASVSDAAGNEAVGSLRRDGSPAVVDTTTLRADTKLTAALVRRLPAKKRKCPRGRPRCTRARVPARVELVPELAVPFGKGAAVSGKLVTAAGAPVADAVVDVLAKPNSTGADYLPVGVVRTKSTGEFAYSAPRGVSRKLRFRYTGAAHQRPSEAEVDLKVAAATTIAVDRKRARNGQRVTFSGRLRGLPVPTGGKVIDLQAYYRGRWRTFGTPRSNSRGAWRLRYRFEATHRTTSYRFRAVVKREAAYPYEEGRSGIVTVRVRGR